MNFIRTIYFGKNILGSTDNSRLHKDHTINRITVKYAIQMEEI